MPELKGYGMSWLAILGVIGLLFGIAGYGLLDNTDYTKAELDTNYQTGYDQAKLDIKPEVITVVENNTVIKYEQATIKELYLDTAIMDFKEWLADNDNLKCDGRFYEFDEMTIGSMRSYDVQCNNGKCDNYDVQFNIRFNFEDDKDSCSHRYTATLSYENDSDEPEIRLN